MEFHMRRNDIEMKRTDLTADLRDSIRYIRTQTRVHPTLAVILGSGLGEIADELSGSKSILTSSIPHYPKSTVVGHKGALVFGKMNRTSLLVFQGRVHFYESGNMDSVFYPIRIAHALGVHTLIVTNAAGGVNRGFSPGDLMLITDHINLTLTKFTSSDLSRVRRADYYDEGLRDVILDVAKNNNITLRQGIYCGVKGPSYETAAEIEMIRRIGGDAIGMSTVNEVALANHLGLRVAGISCITNLATGISGDKLSHDEVTEVATRVKETFAQLLRSIIHAVPS